MLHRLEVARSHLASLVRLGSGGFLVRAGAPPAEPLELYEFEVCPFCRKAREALSALDLDVRVRPCPKRGTRYRPWVEARGGRSSFPYLVDPNRGVEMYESEDIIAYAYREYGSGPPPVSLRLGPLTHLGVNLASAWRAPRGLLCRGKKEPEQELELWSHEASPRSRLVREVLCELELPYLLRNLPRGSSRRPDFYRRFGRVELPVLVDPNGPGELVGAREIIAHLESSYG